MCFQLLVSVRTLRARCSNWQVDFANPSFATSLPLFAIYSKVTDNNVSWGPRDLDTTRVRGWTGWTANANNSLRFSPSRLTCMGFLLLSKGCIPGPHDFASVAGFASHSECLGPREFTLVSPLSPTLSALGRMSLHLSPPCLPIWVPWAAWVYTCLPLVSHSGCLGPHEFILVSPLSPTLGSLGRMSLHLSPPCLPLWVPWAAWVYTCLPLVSHSGFLGPHEFTLVSPCLRLWVPWAAWVYTCLPLVSHSGCLGPHEFALVSPLSPTLGALGRMSLHLSPPCLPLWVPWAAWVYTCFPLSPTLSALGRMSLHLSPPCLPIWVPWAAWVYTCLPLVSHSGCLVHLSPPCLPLSHICLPHLSPTLGSLGRMSCLPLLSPPCLPLWVLWAAWVYTCLPLVSHSGCLVPHEFTLVSHTCLPHLSPPCLPLCSGIWHL